MISEELGLKLEKVELAQLGRAKKVTISKDDTVVLNGAGEKQALVERCDQIRESIEMSTSDYDREKLQERLAKLSGGVAVLKVGGASEVSNSLQAESMKWLRPMRRLDMTCHVSASLRYGSMTNYLDRSAFAPSPHRQCSGALPCIASSTSFQPGPGPARHECCCHCSYRDCCTTETVATECMD